MANKPLDCSVGTFGKIGQQRGELVARGKTGVKEAEAAKRKRLLKEIGDILGHEYDGVARRIGGASRRWNGVSHNAPQS